MKHILQKKITRVLSGIVFLGVAGMVQAQSFGGGSPTSFRELVATIGTTITKQLMPIIVSLAVIVFLFNVGQFILSLDNEKERLKFKKYSMNAIIALFILLSFWGMVGILSTTFFNKNPIIPQLPTSGN